MRRESEVIRFLLAQQSVWRAHFPTLRSRAHQLIVNYLCTKGRGGSLARQLYGATKEVFLLDDSTIRDRLASVQRLDFCITEPPGEKLSGRTVILPTPALLTTHDAYMQAVGVEICAAATAIDAGRSFTAPRRLTERQHAAVLQTLDAYTSAWLSAADRLMEALSLSNARRAEARRRLMSTSYWTLMHRAIAHRFETRAAGQEDEGLIADQLAAVLLDLTGQGIQTTRDHISALTDIGLFERRRGRVLRVALAARAADHFDRMLFGFALDMVDAATKLDAGPLRRQDVDPARHGTSDAEGEQTLRLSSLPDDDDLTVTGLRPFLRIVSPPEAVRAIPLGSGQLTVGRVPPCDIVLAAADVSRHHCQVQVVAGALLVTDFSSTNGTFIDGRRIDAPATLAVGGTLRIGPFTIAFEIAELNGRSGT